MIELALKGDSVALRLCIERLIPKIKQEPIGIDLPKKFDKNSTSIVNDEILHAVFDGRITIEEGERLRKFITEKSAEEAPLKIIATTQEEAMREYERIMKTL